MMSSRRLTFYRLLRSLTVPGEVPADWQPVLQLASDTLTIGTLASSLLSSESRSRLPPEAVEFLTEILSRASQRNRRLTEQFFEILPALNAAGVRPIVMRGMASLLESGSENGRLLSDIDLLLPGERRDQSVDALRSLGFQTFQGFHGPPFSVVLGRGQDTGMVDLHTDLQPYSLGINFDRLAPLCRPVTLEAGEALLPSPTCALIMFILHDQLHDADYWRGLIDVRHLIETRTLVERGVDWPTLASFFPAGAATNAMHVYLRTAKTLLGTDIPEEYCGGAWARLQVRRRLFQMGVPALRSSLTFLTALVDAPLASAKTYRPRRSAKRTLQFKLGRALRPVNPGKI